MKATILLTTLLLMALSSNASARVPSENELNADNCLHSVYVVEGDFATQLVRKEGRFYEIPAEALMLQQIAKVEGEYEFTTLPEVYELKDRETLEDYLDSFREEHQEAFCQNFM